MKMAHLKQHNLYRLHNVCRHGLQKSHDEIAVHSYLNFELRDESFYPQIYYRVQNTLSLTPMLSVKYIVPRDCC